MRTDSPLLRYYYQKLPKYQETGQVTADGCPQGFTKNALGMCVNEAGQTPDQAVAASNILKDVTKKPVVNTKPLATPYKTVSQQVTEATDKARRENYHLDNQATVGQGQASTIDSERARAEKLQQYTNEHPYAQVNSQGNLERTNWDRSMETGQADKGTPAGRTDRFLNDAAISMGIAGDIMTLGELGSGLTGMRSAISNSAEGLSGVKQSGFLGNSKEMFTNPKRYFTKPTSGPTFNPNYENIGRAARGEGDAFGETLSWGDWQEAPRVLDWEKIAETVAGIGIGSGAISGGPSQQKKDGGLHRYQIDGQTKEEITYSHRPRGIQEGFMLNRTQIPYTSYRDIKRNTKVPTDPREVNFISNYAGAIGEPTSEGFVYPTQVPMEGNKHWNIDRFIIDPQYGPFLYSDVTNSKTGAPTTTPQQARYNTLADMYKYYMLQDPEHRGRAFRKAKRFVRNEVDPRTTGSFYNSWKNNDGSDSNGFSLDSFASQNRLKDLYWDEITGGKKTTPEKINQLKDISLDYFKRYGKLSDEESQNRWAQWEQEANKLRETGEYKKGGGMFPEYDSYAPPRHATGGQTDGGLLSRTVTCSNCGWSWKAVDGGIDPTTCHKCGGMIKMKNGGDISIPDLQEGNWLKAYGPGGQTTDGCPPNFYKNAQGKCVPEYDASGMLKKLRQPVQDNTRPLPFYNPVAIEKIKTNNKIVAQQKPQATLGVDRSNEPWRQRQVADIKKYEAMKNSELAQTMGSFTPSGSNADAGVIGAENFVNMNPLITGPIMSTSRLYGAGRSMFDSNTQNPYFNSNNGVMENVLGVLQLAGDIGMVRTGLRNPQGSFNPEPNPATRVELPDFNARNAGVKQTWAEKQANKAGVPSAPTTADEYRKMLQQQKLQQQAGDLLRTQGQPDHSTGGWSPMNNPETNRMVGLAQYGKPQKLTNLDFVSGESLMNEKIYNTEYYKRLKNYMSLGFDAQTAAKKATQKTLDILKNNTDYDFQLGLERNLQRLLRGPNTYNPFSKNFRPEFLKSQKPLGSQAKGVMRANPSGAMDANFSINDPNIKVFGDNVIIGKESVLRPEQISIQRNAAGDIVPSKVLNIYQKQLSTALEKLNLQPYTGTKAFNTLTPNKYGGITSTLSYEDGGSLLKAKHGGWLSKYDEGGPGPKENTVKQAAEKAKQFNKDWMNSPMYKQMLETSMGANSFVTMFDQKFRPTKERLAVDQMASGRKHQLENSQWGVGLKHPSNSEGTLAETYSWKPWGVPLAGSAINYLSDDSEYFDAIPYVNFVKSKMIGRKEDDLNSDAVHEFSHVSDASGQFIPESDKILMAKYADNSAKYAELARKYGKDFAKREEKSNKKWYDYIRDATETRARLIDFRQRAQDQGLYDPFTQKFNIKYLKNYKQISGTDPLNDLRGIYTDEEISDMLNKVAKSKSVNDQPQTMAKHDGWVDKYKGGDVSIYGRRNYSADTPTFFATGGATEDDCPPGWVKGPNGDCVQDFEARRTLAKKSVEVARKHIANNDYFDVPENLKNTANAQNEGAFGCIGGVCSIYTEAGVMSKPNWSNTDFALHAKEYGFPNQGYGLDQLRYLEPGDALQYYDTGSKNWDKAYPHHSQMFLGVNPDSGEYEFFDNFNKSMKSYPKKTLEKLFKSDNEKNRKEYGRIYKVNPYVAGPVVTNPEAIKALEERKESIEFQKVFGQEYKYGIRRDSPYYKDQPIGMKKFIEWANKKENIDALVEKLGVDKGVINDELLNTFGELGQENKWENRTFAGSVLGLEGVYEKVFKPKNKSVGPGQIKFNTISNDLKEKFEINTPKDLYNWDKIIPLMTAMNIKNRKWMENKGTDLSKYLIGKEGVGADELKYGVGRWTPYMYRGSIDTPEDIVMRNVKKDYGLQGAYTNSEVGLNPTESLESYLNSYKSSPYYKKDLRKNSKLFQEGSYAHKVYRNIDENLERSITNQTQPQIGQPRLMQPIIIKGTQKKKQAHGGSINNNWLNKYKS